MQNNSGGRGEDAGTFQLRTTFTELGKKRTTEEKPLRAEQGDRCGALAFRRGMALGGKGDGARRGECSHRASPAPPPLSDLWTDSVPTCSLHTGSHFPTLTSVSLDSRAENMEIVSIFANMEIFHICKDNCPKSHKPFSEPRGSGLPSHTRNTCVQKQRIQVRKGRKESPFVLNRPKQVWLGS